MEMLKVPLFKQPDHSDCGPSCGFMLVNFFNTKINYNELSRSLVRDSGKTNIFDLAEKLFLLTNLPIKLKFFNFLYFNNDFNLLKKEDKIRYIENISAQNRDRIIISALKRCIERNIVVTHGHFFKADIEAIINKGSPVVTLVTVADLRTVKMNLARCHFLLIKGFDRNYFYYNDPHWDKKKFGEHKIQKDRLFISIVKTNFPAILWVRS